jgi:Flp pilus assembly protein TadG
MGSLMFAGRIRKQRSGRQTRTGAASIEAACTLPLLCVLVFSSIEVANIIYLRQSLNIAAYEAGISATKPGVDTSTAVTRVAEVLGSRGITGYTLSFTPTVTEDTPGGTEVQVDVSAPSGSLSIGPLWLFKGKTIRARVRMVRL